MNGKGLAPLVLVGICGLLGNSCGLAEPSRLDASRRRECMANWLLSVKPTHTAVRQVVEILFRTSCGSTRRATTV